MNQIVEAIVVVASVITALGTIIACFSTIHKWILRQNKQDEDIKAIKEDIDFEDGGQVTIEHFVLDPLHPRHEHIITRYPFFMNLYAAQLVHGSLEPPPIV